MGATMYWRQPPDRVDRLHGDPVAFGRGRSRGAGYLAHSDRVGPSVLLLGAAGGHPRADALNAEGFTVLVPDLAVAVDRERVLEAAASYLTDNWHPRLAVIAAGRDEAEGVGTLLRGGARPDVVALYEHVWSGAPRPTVPLVGHFAPASAGDDVREFFAASLEAGAESELYVYEGVAPGFTDHASGGFSPDAYSLAEARTVDALEYFLS